LSCSNIIAH